MNAENLLKSWRRSAIKKIVNDWVLSAYEALDILLSTKIQNHAKYCEKKKPSKLRKQVNGLDVEAILQKNKVMGKKKKKSFFIAI